MGEKELSEKLKNSNESLEKAGIIIKDLKDKLDNNDNSETKEVIEKLKKELSEKLKNSNESLEKSGIIIKDLKAKLDNNNSSEAKEVIEKLKKELAEKNIKVVELAESVAKTQPPPRRVKLNVKYSNKYTPSQLKSFQKNGISIENLDKEPEPVDTDIPEIKE